MESCMNRCLTLFGGKAAQDAWGFGNQDDRTLGSRFPISELLIGTAFYHSI